MSIEIVLLPVAIAATQAIASYLAENESGRLYTMPTVMKDEDLLKKRLTKMDVRRSSLEQQTSKQSWKIQL